MISFKDDSEDEPATTTQTRRASVQTTTSRPRPVISGVKRPIQPQPGTKTRPQPKIIARTTSTTTSRSLVEEDDGN